MQAGKLVSRPMREMLWTDFKGGDHGYGFQVDQGPAGKVVGHSGGFTGSTPSSTSSSTPATSSP